MTLNVARRCAKEFAKEVAKNAAAVVVVQDEADTEFDSKDGISPSNRLATHSANPLAGRAVSLQLHPFTARELGDAFSLASALRFGTLPGLLPLESEEEKNAFLRAYALIYMKEEVWAEQLVR